MQIFHPGPKLERWKKIFKDDGRSLIVALDHIPSGLMNGWEFPDVTIRKIMDGKPDAIMTNFGILKQYAPLLSDEVGTILRVDGGPSYLLEDWPNFSRWEDFFSAEDAINLGASAVIVNTFIGGRSEVECLKIATKLASDCFKVGMPCAFEPIPSSKMVKNEYSPEAIAFAARMAAEFGADFIKTLYTGDAKSFEYVTSRCPIPILIAGGPKAKSDLEFFETICGALEGGGRGVFVGRNVWQHTDPAAMLRSLRMLIHENANIQEVVRALNS